MSVHVAHLDTTYGFFNGTSAFLCVEDAGDQRYLVDIQPPAGEAYRDRCVATALREVIGHITGKAGTKRYDFDWCGAASYDKLINHPVEMGTFELASFEACDTRHDAASTGHIPNPDLERIARDFRCICEAQVRLLELQAVTAPFLDSSQRYVFMTMATTDGYDSLEHRASTTLTCAHASPSVTGRDKTTEGYHTFFDLVNHEYLYTWNVKRIKPATFIPYASDYEVHTLLLWLFGGFMNYYDDLMLVCSGLISEAQYLEVPGRAWNGVLRGSGRLKQSVAESLFDAWTKYYHQDESALNAIVNCYARGLLVALTLDLTARMQIHGKHSLDDVMRTLWVTYGRDSYAVGYAQRDIAEAGFITLMEETAGAYLRTPVRQLIEGCDDLPLPALLKAMGVSTMRETADLAFVLGVKIGVENSFVKLQQIFDDSPMRQSGLSAGDLVVTIGGPRMPTGRLGKMLARHRVGDTVPAHVSCRGELTQLDVTLAADTTPQLTLTLAFEPLPLYSVWLGKRTAARNTRATRGKSV